MARIIKFPGAEEPKRRRRKASAPLKFDPNVQQKIGSLKKSLEENRSRLESWHEKRAAARQSGDSRQVLLAEKQVHLWESRILSNWREMLEIARQQPFFRKELGVLTDAQIEKRLADICRQLADHKRALEAIVRQLRFKVS
jgi:hypothetical protein